MGLNRLQGKTAIVTGAGQGIGAAIARVFAAEGTRVVIAVRTESHGQATPSDIVAAGGEARLCVKLLTPAILAPYLGHIVHL